MLSGPRFAHQPGRALTYPAMVVDATLMRAVSWSRISHLIPTAQSHASPSILNSIAKVRHPRSMVHSATIRP